MTDHMLNEFKKIELNESERAASRNALLSYMQANPVRTGKSARLHLQSESMLTSITRFLTPHTMSVKIAVSALVAVLLGGSVSYAAESSLPGDTLYPVKVSFNEEVRARTSLSAESKASWEARRAERRLEEAETLTLQGKLDSTSRATLEENFERHAVNAASASKENADLEASASSEFETSLRAHEQILARLAEDNGNAKVEVNALLVRVRSKAKIVAENRADAEKKITGDSSVRIKASAEQKVRIAEDTILRAKTSLGKFTTTAEGRLSAEAKLQTAEKHMVEAKTKLKAGAYIEAFSIAGTASKIANEAKVTAQRSHALKMDIKLDDPLGIDVASEIDADEDIEAEVNSVGDAKETVDLDVNLDAEINSSGNINIEL